MALFDELKNKLMQATRRAATQAVHELEGKALDKAKTFMESKGLPIGGIASSIAPTGGAPTATYMATLERLPRNLEEVKALPEASLTQPQFAAVLTVAALCLYPSDKNAALEILDFLNGPKEINGQNVSFLDDRFRGKDYVPRSYWQGATPENNYQPDVPYTAVFTENAHSRDAYNEGYLKLFVRSGGADSPRPMTLRLKPSTRQWFLWEQYLLVDVRPPKENDPWA